MLNTAMQIDDWKHVCLNLQLQDSAMLFGTPCATFGAIIKYMIQQIKNKYHVDGIGHRQHRLDPSDCIIFVNDSAQHHLHHPSFLGFVEYKM